MELIKITDRISYLPGEQRTDRPLLYYIRGDRYSVAVDAGNSRAHVELFYSALTAAGLLSAAFFAGSGPGRASLTVTTLYLLWTGWRE